MFLITPSALLMDCPRCGTPLGDTKSPSANRECICGYSEPATSARIMTFVESALDEYLRHLKINTFRADDKKIDSTTGVSATGCLSIFASRASEIFNSRTGLRNQGIFSISSVPDENAYLKERCVTTSHQVNIPLTLLLLVEVVHEAIELRPTFKQRHFNNELPVKHLLENHNYGQHGSVMDVSFNRTLNPKMTFDNKPIA